MKVLHPDAHPTRPTARALPPGWLAAVLLAVPMVAGCGDQNACHHPPPEVGAVVVDAQASTDPCTGQMVNHIVAWFTRQGIRYPLPCGRRDPRGFGYLHIRDDQGGHGDPVNDATFRAEMANTLEHGIERLASGGSWRYTVKYYDAKAPASTPGTSASSSPARRTCQTGTRQALSPPCTTATSRTNTHIESVMAHAARSDAGRTSELVATLQGWQFPESNVVVEDISLRSPAGAWPPRIRIDYRIRGQLVET